RAEILGAGERPDLGPDRRMVDVGPLLHVATARLADRHECLHTHELAQRAGVQRAHTRVLGPPSRSRTPSGTRSAFVAVTTDVRFVYQCATSIFTACRTFSGSAPSA